MRTNDDNVAGYDGSATYMDVKKRVRWFGGGHRVIPPVNVVVIYIYIFISSPKWSCRLKPYGTKRYVGTIETATERILA